MATTPPFTGPSPAGVWQLRIRALTPLQDCAAAEIRVERGDTPDGFRGHGRQSCLIHPAFRRHDDERWRLEEDDPVCPIKRLGTISDIAMSERAVVVTGYRAADGRLSDFSAARSKLMRHNAASPRQPSLAAVAEDSAARPSVLAAGNLSGSLRALRGTSAAAPLMLRAAILAALDGRRVTPAEHKARLTRAAVPGAAAAACRLGAGRHPARFGPTPGRRSP